MEETLTKAERAELRSLIRRRAGVAKKDVDARRDTLIADFEEELTVEFQPDDERWEEIVRTATRAVQDAERDLQAACETAGIRKELRPHVGVQWLQGGRQDIEQRKGALRRLAARRLEALATQAKLEIDRQAIAIESRLAATALRSAEAAEWLASLPQVDELVPALDIGSVRRELEMGGEP
jgi:hypothetical protein